MKAVGITVVLVVLAAGIWVLRENTMARHHPIPDGSSLELMVVARTRSPEDPMLQLTRAQLDMCVAESVPGATVVELQQLDRQMIDATDDLDEPTGPRHGAYLATMEPGADEPDREQLHGCLEDLRVRRLRMDVHRMTMLVDGEARETWRS